MKQRTAHNFVDLTGQTFHRLTVVRRDTNRYGGQAFWVCKCQCGTDVFVNTASLRSGHTKSCGCHAADTARRHGMYKRPEYLVWQQMKERCYNPRKASYARYGAVGITVCARWRRSFEAFYTDMGNRPTGYTLERIDNARGYSPKNCRWASWHDQYRNREQNVWIEYDGRTQCRKDWAREFGIDEATLSQRLARGWDIHTALRAPRYYSYARSGPMQGALLDMLKGE